MDDERQTNVPPPASRQQLDTGWIEAVKSTIVPLTDPKSFLLFIFAIMTLITFGDYLRDERNATAITTFITKVEDDRVSELQSQHDIVVQLLNLISNMNTLPNSPKYVPPPVGN